MPSPAPRISAIVLAAGESKRFGPPNKLLTDWNGKPLIRSVVETVLSAGPTETIVVTGHDKGRIEEALAGLPVRLAHNERFERGMGASIAVGVESADPDAEGLWIVLGDMPRLARDTLARVLQAFEGPDSIIVPQSGDREGNPVLFGSAYRSELAALDGNLGARSVVEAHRERTRFVEVEEAQLEDLDEPS